MSANVAAFPDVAAPSPATLGATLRTSGALRWIAVGRLFDGERVTGEAHLVYDDKVVLHAGAEPPPVELVGAHRRDPDVRLPGHTALPGLIEAHAHLFLEGGEEDPGRRAEYLTLPSDALLARATGRLPRLVRLGVLGVRDAGDRHGVGLALQAASRSAERGLMPYVDSPGAAIHHQGRYGAFMGRPIEAHDGVNECVAERVAAGAHRIKLLATGIINFEKGAVTAKPQMPADELTAAVAAARRHGRQTFAHCSGNDGVSNCIAARVDSIEHGFFVDADQLARMRDLDMAWVPTFAPVQFQLDRADELGWSATVRDRLRRILDGHASSLERAARLGVRIVAGSDAGSHGVPHGWGLFRELELMEAAGLSATEVLRSATGAGAERLGYAEPVGFLRVGARARFILTEHPVLESAGALREPRIVVFDGAIESTGDDPEMPGL